MALPASAQSPWPAPAGSTPTVTTPPPAAPSPLSNPSYGIPLAPDRGPWVLGEIRFAGNTTISEYSLQSKVRARHGNLYMPEDVAGDVKTLMETGSFASVAYGIYAIPDQPIPSNYTSIAISTSMVRLVFAVMEKGQAQTGPGGQAAAPKKPIPVPPSPVSGVVLTPTAYRGFGTLNEPGLGLDINAVYYIGRLYGKNSLDYTTERTNYLDRIGIWLLSTDGKIQLQSEGRFRPAMAVGAQGYFTFRDAPQPSITTPNVSVKVSQKTTKGLADAYVVFSKKFWGLRSSVGYMQGNFGDFVSGLSEFLSPQALTFNGHLNQTAESKSVLFANLLLLPRKEYPLAVEFIKPNGMALHPWLLNFKIGYFLHLNFDVSYLRFAGGWDLLGTFQFRVNYFPRR